MLALCILEVTRNTLLNLCYSMKMEVDVISPISGKHSGSFSMFSIQICSVHTYELPTAAFFGPVLYPICVIISQKVLHSAV